MISANERPGPGIRGVVGGQFQPCQPTTSPALAASIEPLLTKADVAKILRVNPRTIDRMRSAGRLPKPDLILKRSGRWKPSTIRALIEAGGQP